MNEQEFWAIMGNMPEPVTATYRLYYDDLGRPITYTSELLPGNYIEIDQQTCSRGPLNVRVVNGELVTVEPKPTVTKLAVTDTGTACHPDNVAVVVDVAQPHVKWSIQTNENN
jgi:hypothetical protein